MRISAIIFFSVCLLSAVAANALDDWTQQTPSPHPGGRANHSMAYAGDDQVLLFGGWDGAYDAETWVYDLSANTWTLQIPASSPSARYHHEMAYIGGDKVLLFGGLFSGGSNDSTWVYDLSKGTWTLQDPTSSPSARYGHAMAYIGGDEVLLFGGYDTNGRDDETWVYDLSANTWTQKSPASQPSERRWQAMAYIGGDEVLLFGGHDGDYDGETWVYDLSANTWILKNPAEPKPEARVDHAMAYIGGDRVLLFGGYDLSLYNDTWIYDLSANIWMEDTNTTQPSERNNHGLSESSMDGTSYLVLFGGNNGTDETWTFGGGDYSLPVTLSSFTAEGGDGTVTLLWTTQSEHDNLGFHLFRTEGNRRDYHRITQDVIPGAGNSSFPRHYSWTDRHVKNGTTYRYWLMTLDIQGGGFKHGPAIATPMAMESDAETLPENCRLFPNYPNPFNPETWIDYQLSKDSHVSVEIYNVGGQLVRTLVNGQQQPGLHRVRWDGRDQDGTPAASGVYLCQLRSERLVETSKMILLR